MTFDEIRKVLVQLRTSPNPGPMLVAVVAAMIDHLDPQPEPEPPAPADALKRGTQ
jgi:hypothetical protein